MQRWYAVSVGRKPGIYDNFEEYQNQVKNFSGCWSRSFNTWDEAAEWLEEDEDSDFVTSSYLGIDSDRLYRLVCQNCKCVFFR